MATFSRSESRRLYSWWWDSHNTPKNSKWLQENLSDIDGKVKSMIKLIEEDADSFARRAEMYYEKRPELINMVEQFYRAYRALAERYSHATGELRHAHKTLAKVFPAQIALKFDEKSPSREEEEEAEVESNEHLLFSEDESLQNLKGFMFRANEVEIESSCGSDEILGKAGHEVQSIRKAFEKIQVENSEFQECLERLYKLEHDLHNVAENSMSLDEIAFECDVEGQVLKVSLMQLQAEMIHQKEASDFQNKCCKETISELERKLYVMKDDAKRLTDEVFMGSSKLRSAVEKCTQLETSNLLLQAEADTLLKRIASKDQELSRNQVELKDLKTCMQYERVQLAKVEASLHSLQDLHFQSTNDQLDSTLELQNLLKVLEDMDVSNSVEKFQYKSLDVQKNQNAVLSLREIKERLEKEVLRHIGFGICMQKEVSDLKKETEGLTSSYESLVEQLQAAGLDTKFIGSSIKILQEEKEGLKQACEQERKEKANMSLKLEKMEAFLQKNAIVEKSLIDLDGEMESLREKLSSSQESCHFLQGERASLVAEKASLLRQLQGMTESAHNLLERNAVLENSLSSVKVELEVLREKSKGLEEICELLKDERSHLMAERATLIFKLGNVEGRLESIEKSFSGFRRDNYELEKKNETALGTVEVSLRLERQERRSSRSLCYNLEMESPEELDKPLKMEFEMQKFVKDMEEKNCALLIECQKHVEASKLAENLISKLQNESLHQQMETELLLDEIEALRLGIYQIFRHLDLDSDLDPETNHKTEQALISQILQSIHNMKYSILKHEDEKHEFFVEKTVLLTLFKQLQAKAAEVESAGMHTKEQFRVMAERMKEEQDENVALRDAVNSLRGEIQTLKVQNNRMNHDMENRQKVLLETEAKLSDSELKLEAAENMNLALCRTLEELRIDIQETGRLQGSLQRNLHSLSAKNSLQEKEIAGLKRLLNSSVSEVDVLRQEIEENIIREQTLNMELEDVSNEFENLEAEASSLFFDLQVLSILEILLKNKIEEVSMACLSLENECAVKSTTIEQMKGRICLMEKELTGLKSQMNENEPIISSFQNEVSLLETYVQQLQRKLEAEYGRGKELLEVAAYFSGGTSQPRAANQPHVSLQNLQMRGELVRKSMEEAGRPFLCRQPNFYSRQDAESLQMRSHQDFSRKKIYLNGPDASPKVKVSDVRLGMWMKDIPIDEIANDPQYPIQKRGSDDQILELWGPGEDFMVSCDSNEFSCGSRASNAVTGSSVSDEEVDDRKILEGLYSDAQKLENLQSRIQSLRWKVSISRKSSRDSKSDVFSAVEQRLQEAEAAVAHLVDLNGQLVQNIEECPADDASTPRLRETVRTWRMKVVEQARRGAEGIAALQTEVQKIKHAVLELENAQRGKQRGLFFRSSRAVVMKESAHGSSGGGRRSSGRHQKDALFF